MTLRESASRPSLACGPRLDPIGVDVLVVGLGPGGAMAAWRAAQAGLTVLAVEKKARIGEPVQCAELVPSPLVEYTRADGVLMQRIAGMKTYLPSGAVDRSDFPGLMVDRAAFDRALAQRAADAGAELRTHTRLIAFDRAGSRARIATPAGPEETVQYRTLIAADGPHSAVARLAGLAPLPVVQTRQYSVPLSRPYTDTDIWLSDEYPGGYGWLFPKDDVANLGLGADRRYASDLKQPLERLRAQLVREGAIGPEILGRTGGDIPVGGLREVLAIDNVLFVGDAAGLTHPISGAGIAAAVQSGERAGQAVAEFIRDRRRDALAAYEEDMREQYGPTLARAVERRAWLARFWRKAAANEDRVQRRGWIAFPEYYHES